MNDVDQATMEWAKRAAAEVAAAGPQKTRPLREFITELKTGRAYLDAKGAEQLDEIKRLGT